MPSAEITSDKPTSRYLCACPDLDYFRSLMASPGGLGRHTRSPGAQGSLSKGDKQPQSGRPGHAAIRGLCPPYAQLRIFQIVFSSPGSVAVADSLVSMPTLSSGVSRNFKPIPTKLHAAPASFPLLAPVMKMQHTLITLAHAPAVHFGK